MDAMELLRAGMKLASERYWEIADLMSLEARSEDPELKAVQAEYNRLADEYEQLMGEPMMFRNCRVLGKLTDRA